MYNVTGKKTEDQVLIELSGRIDSNNSPEVEKKIDEILGGQTGLPVTVNAEGLEYISSAGLRVLLHLKKTNPSLTIKNVQPDVYEIFDMTGFTQMMTVEKAYKVISIEGCEEIGSGVNGSIYRIDSDNVVKVYKNANALDEIQHEREVARIALILGIPTAISYDVVKVGDSYGSVFELLNASSFSNILATRPDRFDWCVNEYVRMLKRIHGTVVEEGKLPDMKQTVIKWVDFTGKYLPEEIGNKLRSMVEAVPQDMHMIHGDYHTKNLMLQGDEVLLIDMDTLAHGYPIFELASIYNAFIGFSEMDHEHVKRFQGFDFDTSCRFWKEFLRLYLGTDNEDVINSVANKARIVGYTRLIRMSIRRGGLDAPETLAEIENWKRELIELVESTDDLLFEKNEITVPAETDNWPKVLEFIESRMEAAECSPKVMMQVELAAEEIYVNIAHYAYAPGKGDATLRIETYGSPAEVTLTFMDKGTPFDPLKKDDPDVTLGASERDVGGLGIFMTKKVMDEVTYEYAEGHNILKMVKKT